MRRTRSSRNMVKATDEIERFIRVKHQIRKTRLEMAEFDNNLLKDIVIISQEESHSSVVNSVILANNFGLKSSLFQIVQQR